jgi:hypothetical protein
MINETDLRDAFATRASEVPSAAVARLRAVDYRPRTRRVRPPVALGALAGAGSITAVVLAIVGLGTNASSAFAGWSATPTQASPAQTSKAEAACKAQLGSALPTGDQPVLSDTRGPFTIVIFSNGTDSNASCINGPSFTSAFGAAGSNLTVPAGRVQLTTSHFATSGDPYTVVEGHVGAGVTGVVLSLTDGKTVTATLSNGWFTAWWPGSADATSADVTTAGGSSTQHLVPGARCGGPYPCQGQHTSSAFGSASGGGRGSAPRGPKIGNSMGVQQSQP